MKKVLVAMSGGVDSSVAAALLKKQGCSVVGAYMKNFSEESWQGIVKTDCPWQQDLADAQAVCAKLEIEFRSFNFEKEYCEKVIEYFFAEYAAGRTPNPDIMCNKEIKFGLFLEKALESGFDYIATGHYARVGILNPESDIKATSLPSSLHHLERRHPLPKRWGGKEGEVEYQLLKGIDPKKDQSYFLYTLTQNQLAHSLFPIGEYTKAQVRELAREFGLPNAEKKDSQGICFVGHINLREFLKQRIPEKVGEIVTTTGQVIGSHPGAAFYTIGQREGIGIGGGTPFYVVQKDVVRNRLVVSQNGPSTGSGTKYSLSEVEGEASLSPELVEGYPSLYVKSVVIKNLHWIDPLFHLPLTKGEKERGWRCTAKIRYQQKDQDCTVLLPSPGDGEGGGEVGAVEVQFKRPQFAPAPGQAVVFYQGEVTLGGGIIDSIC